MAMNRRPLYQSHETIRLERPKPRRAPQIIGAVAAITLAGALLGNGLRPAAPAAPASTARGVTGSARGAIVAAPPAGEAAAPTAAPRAQEPRAAGSLVVGTGGDGLRLRSAPSTDAPVAAVLADGAALVPMGEPVSAGGRSWVPVRAGDVQGWVAAEYVEAAS